MESRNEKRETIIQNPESKNGKQETDLTGPLSLSSPLKALAAESQ
ncbi:hypothetical protein HYFRA_00003496 [Hymenoscyphus fraxineus]|uniref:Uncharacterized protein n=1 Tax=Hymenoscyphus fraxineus TaxID=746836 RepID=A0A9N9KTP8_9HELO|nr:hypothetical protein HYFRA_00003496 [Hymenoscyphus fraxineus]